LITDTERFQRFEEKMKDIRLALEQFKKGNIDCCVRTRHHYFRNQKF